MFSFSIKSNSLKSLLNSVKIYILLGLLVSSTMLSAQNTYDDSDVNLNKIPPRIIRACCAFGYDLKLWGIPFVNIDQVISIEDLGEHHYMGNSKEGVGTIYTNKGGFLDIGHLRDQIDWTRYLYTTILAYRGKGKVVLRLRNEAGRKQLHLDIPNNFSDDDCILLAGKIAYDFSLWHEISTWFGASTIPLLHEKFSSFSVEDVYSNLLGIHVGMKTLRTKQPFNTAATEVLNSTLDSLDVVKTAKETYDAYNAIHNKWYTSKKRIPNINITLVRDTDVLTKSRPWIVPNSENSVDDGIVLDVPLLDTKGHSLTDFYDFTITINYRIPKEEIFPNRENSIVNQNDFELLIDRINAEIQTMEEKALVEEE